MSGGMLSKLLIAWSLMTVCVAIHALGLTAALRWLRGRLMPAAEFWPMTRRFAMLAGWMILLHLCEIAVWAVTYARSGAMPDLPSALYFSAVTYTTTGYGDLVLPQEWRLVGGVEALTGILMCGWSTGVFFAVVSRAYEQDGPAAPRGREFGKREPKPTAGGQRHTG
jgi:hypothetical protein